MKLLILFTLLSPSMTKTITNPTVQAPFPPWDPDMDLDVPQIIRRHGYPSESHVVETEDGYLLSLHRVAGNKQEVKGGQPVLLQHGLMGSSADWVLNGENSLTFYLADNGYDVWLGNARGNIYSKAHTTLSVNSLQFWSFSWHEMGTKDLPAVINYISNQTNKAGEIIYIGHSMGTTMSYVLAATLPSVTEQLKLIVSLAPTVYMTHLRSPLRYLAPFSYDIAWITKFIGLYDFAPTNWLLRWLSYECLHRFVEAVCSKFLFMTAGFTKNEFNMTRLPEIVAHDPAGTSVRTVLHYAQEIKIGGMFQQFDHGPEINMAIYNSRTPPQYNISNIKAPFYLMYSLNDILTSPIDVIHLSNKLPNLAGLYEVPEETFGHCDFIFGMNAFKYVYKPLLEKLSTVNIKK